MKILPCQKECHKLLLYEKSAAAQPTQPDSQFWSPVKPPKLAKNCSAWASVLKQTSLCIQLVGSAGKGRQSRTLLQRIHSHVSLALCLSFLSQRHKTCEPLRKRNVCQLSICGEGPLTLHGQHIGIWILPWGCSFRLVVFGAPFLLGNSTQHPSGQKQ